MTAARHTVCFLPWHGDATRLAQVFASLLTNAARYTEPGGNIRLPACKDGDDVVISARDNGRGVEPELLAHAFDLFFQGRQGVDRQSCDASTCPLPPAP